MKSLSFEPPKLDKRIVAVSDDPFLAAQVSSYFNEDGTYFTVLESPRFRRLDWTNEVIRLNNTIALIQPEKILLIGLSDRNVVLIKNQLRLSDDRYVVITKRSHIQHKLDGLVNPKFSGELLCPPDLVQISLALLKAKNSNLLLRIKSGAVFNTTAMQESEHCICFDSINSENSVLVANYAFAVNADLIWLNLPNEANFFSREVVNECQRSDLRGENESQLSGEINSLLSQYDKTINQYRFITSFSKKIPVGCFYPSIPSVYIQNSILPGYSLVSSIMSANLLTKVGVVIDPGFFENSETDDVVDALAPNNVFIKEIRENDCQNDYINNTLSTYPYDFFFICSHGGPNPKGTKMKIKFNDTKGCEHIITLIEGLQFSHPGLGHLSNEDMVMVSSFYEFVDFDEKPWGKKVYKPGSSRYPINDFIMKTGRKKWEIIETETDVEMKYCNTISTRSPFHYFPMLHSVSAPDLSPFIFNNSCNSFYELADRFAFYGVSFYIGTLRSVDSDEAAAIARRFTDNAVNSHEPISISLWKAQNVDGLMHNNSYVACGCHFARLSFDNADEQTEITNRLNSNLGRHIQSLSGSEESVRQNHIDLIGFLKGELDLL